MARAWRIEYDGALYHVLSRGNEKQDIVINDDDRKLFLATAGEMAERFEIDLFAYFLLDNHYLCEASHNTITCYFEPIEQTCPEACNGLGPPIPKDLTCVTIAAVIYYGKICATVYLWEPKRL
jgi:hypothetical protein